VAGRISIFIEFELIGDVGTFESIFREIVDLNRQAGSDFTYDFFRDPAEPEHIFALESHADAEALGAHFERSVPLLQKAWACARPVQTRILGDLPAPMAERMRQNGVTVVPWWMGR
jgi:quinol monooxygenase YgiN